MRLKNKRLDYISYDKLCKDNPSKEQIYSRLKYHLADSLIQSRTIDKLVKKYDFSHKELYNLFEILNKNINQKDFITDFGYISISTETICTLVYHMSNVIVKSLPN